MLTFNKLGRYGRLGNQMFQIASTIGIARKQGYNYGFPAWKNYDHKERFKSDEDIDVQKYFRNPLPEVAPGEYPEHNIPWGYHNVVCPDGVSLHGHMQSEKYFDHCADEVYHYFKMKEPEGLDIEIMPGVVAIHLRAGDYGGDYHPVMDMDYYNSAMAVFPDHPFLVFSDEIQTCREMFGDRVDYMEANDYMTDFYLMTQCDHFIISNSTYSWWAAWLGRCPGKRVVAPRKWFGPAAKLETKDIYPDNWIVI